jgi:SAM-dependent methyltransferase
MQLLDIVHRTERLEPWIEGDNIPWHQPGFSARMLREHLSQEHDAASRRTEKIARHVTWIDETLLSRVPTRILDLGCGPGLYTARLAALGHDCIGIDYSPASIEFAREQARERGLSCSYVEGDVREAAYGNDYGLVMMVFGELNVFKPEDARSVLAKAHGALREQGILLLEPHTFAAVKRKGEKAPTWYASPSGLFLDAPHLCLIEYQWHEERRAATTRYFVLAAASGDITRHAQSMRAYTEPDYEALLRNVGFDDVTFHESLTGSAADAGDGLLVITARKPPVRRTVAPGSGAA